MAAALACAAAASCRAPTAGAPAPAPEPAPRFPHGPHAAVACVDCHPVADRTTARLARPGSNDHAPCDRAECHRAEFLSTPGPLCTVCHEDVDPTGAAPSELVPYPPPRGRGALPSAFSHASHVRWDAMEAAVGFHVACGDCHRPAANRAAPGLPGHATCARCHVAEAAPPGAPRMTECAACHRSAQGRAPRRPRLIAGDLRFAHADHEVDRRGKPIRCAECHTDIASVARRGAHRPPPTAACVACHDDDSRTPPELSMRECETCHATRSASFGTLAPRSHLPATARPENHTLAFRRDHATEARVAGETCARCHLLMSGSSRDTCDECHRAMRPHDHTIGWREFDHGPQAATESERCATCHAGDFCIACHARPPRSHLPLVDFAAGGHAVPAALDTRACMACHDVARDCLAPCHGGPR
ncbi:MAG: hypothetical protein D6689_04295 [Deltaproteobacteria bacterium]|nr:MAG: hypothetical protein D6689_04295 [Deltaproteobacteria bacterium]